jgi:cobalt-zinc-cadmium efflux system membrane fusion protein
MKHSYILFLFLLVACSKTANNESENVEPIHSEEEICLSESQVKAVNIRMDKIEKRELNNVVRANGELALSPQKKASVNSLTGGIIRQILVLEGKTVTAGQVVAYLENTEIVELQKQYLITKKEVYVAEQDAKRQKELISQGAGIEKTLQQAAANFDMAQAQLNGLEKQLNQLSISPEQVSMGNLVTQIPIKAPISGTIDKIYVNIGSYVDIQNPLMTLSDNSQIHCDLNLFEKDIHWVENGQEIDISLTNQPGIYLKGEIYGVNTFFENETKAVTVHAIIRDKKSLKLFPGMYVTALINVGKQKTDAVPNEAIINQERKKYIFVFEGETEKEDEKQYCFRRLEVITGISELGYTQITPVEKWEENAQIVVSGAFYLSSISAGDGEEE